MTGVGTYQVKNAYSRKEELMSYYPFTVDERERARRTDLVELLRRCGEEVKPSGSEFQWKYEGQKVTIRGNLWFHQYEQVGGDAVDFMARFYGLNYIHAIKTLLGLCAPTIREEVVPFEQKPLEIPPKHDNMRRVYAYLCRQREIAKEVLDYFVYRKLVYESSDYHNAVFVGYDSEMKMRHLHKHSTASRGGFKGNAPGSVPEHSFHWTGADDSLFVFESPIDLLSFITLHPSGWRNHSYAACCGVSDRVLWQSLKEQPYLKQVYICLDSDEPGQRAANQMADNLTARNIQNKILVPNRKDWNEDLIFARRGAK